MPWKVSDAMSLREEFVALAGAEGANVAELCRRFSISRKTGYKWLARRAAGEPLADRSRRPRGCPHQSDAATEQAVLAVRDAHPCWGGRKIRAVLLRRGEAAPAPSTVTAILRRHGRIAPGASEAATPPHRFEHERPNDLWQMDFKGHFGLADGSRCHPLTVLDDHSRFNVLLRACGDERTPTVKAALTEAFRRYGLPRRMLMDNGPPWGGSRSVSGHGLTPLTVWLLRLDVAVTHGRPMHPQTQGKNERFHRTLKAEALREQRYHDRADAQRALDRFRHGYNHERPHEALGMATPIRRYAPSVRPFPETLPAWEYPSAWAVRKVQRNGELWLRGRTCRLPDALAGEAVGLEPTTRDGVFTVRLGPHAVGRLDVRPARPAFACDASARCARSAAAGGAAV